MEPSRIIDLQDVCPISGPTTTTGWRTLLLSATRSEEGDVAPIARKAITPSTNSWTVDGSRRDSGGSSIELSVVDVAVVGVV